MTAFLGIPYELLAVTAVVAIGFGAAIPWVFYLERKQRERQEREQVHGATEGALTDADIDARLTEIQQSLAEMQAYLRQKRGE